MGRTTFYSQKYQGWPPVPNGEMANSDSLYWQRQADLAIGLLRSMLGENYELWAEMTWPGDEAEKQSWRQIALRAQEALRCGKEHLLASLECGCVLPEQSCPVCRAQARLTWGKEKEEDQNG